MKPRLFGQFSAIAIAIFCAAIFPWHCSAASDDMLVGSQAATFRPKLIGQGVELHAQGIVIGDGEVLLWTSAVQNGATTSKKLDQFLKSMALSFDTLEFRIQTDFDRPWPQTTAVANAFIDRAHDFNLKVALNYWRYPGTLNVPEEFRAYKLDDSGQLVPASFDDDHVKVNHIDKGNPTALAWFGDQLSNGLRTVPDFDSFLIVEDKVSSWVQTDDWPQRVRYWDSPTYSQADLRSFQAFLLLHDQQPRLFPVDRREFIRSNLTELVATDDPLWSYWYEWRFELFVNYMVRIHQTVEAQNRSTSVTFMPWQRVVNELTPVSQDDWHSSGWSVGLGEGVAENAIFGVSAKKIAKRRAVDVFVLEYGEDGTRWGWPMELNKTNARKIAHAVVNRIAFGSFIQLYNYSDQRHVIPELVVDELNIAKTYNAKTLVIYDVATVFNQSARYDPELAKYWRAIVARKLVRFDDPKLITTIRRQVLAAKGKQSGLDPNRPGPPSMPADVGAWYDRSGTIYVSTIVFQERAAPFFAVADNWGNPWLTLDNWFEVSPDRGYVAIRRPDLIGRGFQVVDKYVRWAPIAETPGVCGLRGIECRNNSWLFKPIAWSKIDWTGFGWKP